VKDLSIVIPVYNEEKILEDSITKIRNFSIKNMSNYKWGIIIANNASTDNTLKIAKKLSKKYNNVGFIHLNKKGRGRALRKAWTESNSDILCYMDVDLSTDLGALPNLIKAIDEGYDVVTGSRFLPDSKVERKLKREILSRGYNSLLKLILNVKFKDAQCGFKAVNKRIVKEIIPLIKNNEWFFDTELLVLSEKKGYKIKEIPVKWTEDKDSKVRTAQTSFNYIKSIFRLRKELKNV